MKRKFIYSFLLILFFLPLILITGCYKSTSDQNKINPADIGWAVGLMEENQITILHTGNGGSEWTKQTQLCTGFSDFQGVSAATSDVAWAVGGKANGYGVIIRTKDGGEGWCRVGKAPDIGDVILYGIKAFNKDVAWIAGENSTVLHTIDGGLTWEKPQFNNLPKTTFYAVTQSGNSVWIAGSDGNAGVLMYSSDGGATWIRQGEAVLTSPLNNIQVINQQLTVVSGKTSVYLTRDGGATWNSIMTSSSDEIKDVCATDDKNLWVASTHDKLFHSADLGVSWQQVTLPAGIMTIRSITGIQGGKIWLAGQFSDGACMVLFSDNGGQSWVRGNTDAKGPLTGISFVSGVK